MSISLSQSRENLAAILEAVELYRNTKSESVTVRDALYDQIYAASSSVGEGAQRFRSPDISFDGSAADWLSTIDAAALDTQSAYLLAAVAVEHGEVNSNGFPSPPGDLLNSAVSSAQTELLELKSFDGHSRFESLTDTSAPSPDLLSAQTLFCGSVDKAITQILDTSDHTVSSLIESVTKHGCDLLGALEALPQLASLGNGVSGFVALACAKINSALAYLKSFLAPLGSDQIKGLLNHFRPKLNVRDVLEAVYQVDVLRKDTAELRLRPNIGVSDVDGAIRELAKLMKQFERFMSGLRAASSGLLIAAGIVVAHLAAPMVPLVAPAVNALTVSIALVAGLSCLGEMRILKEVRGIRVIEDGLKLLIVT